MKLSIKAFPGARLALAAVLSASPLVAQTLQHFKQTNLVSNIAGVAAVTDSNLVNPWGLSRSSTGPWWVSDNGTGLSTLYSGTGSTVPLVVTVPSALPDIPTGSPTGTIYNGTQGFAIAPGKPAVFLFVTEDGTISGWNPTVNAKAAVVMVNTKQASVFKGLTMASVKAPFTGPTSFLYVADLRNSRVQIFDENFHHDSELENRFQDRELPAGFAPFNVQNIGGNIYVAFAAQASGKHDEVAGAGLGYVDVFTPTGTLLVRFDHGNYLNAPWGLAEAPSDFGVYSHDILVGNFGSGEITAFNPTTGRYEGKLMDAANQPIAISGLWGLSFGNGASSGPATSLYFAAGSNGEAGGLLGSITAIENLQGNDQ